MDKVVHSDKGTTTKYVSFSPLFTTEMSFLLIFTMNIVAA